MSIWQALGFSAPNTNVQGQQALAGELYDQRQQFANQLGNYQNRTAPQQQGASVGNQQVADTAQTARPDAPYAATAAFNANPIFAQNAAATPVAHTAVGPTANVQAAQAGGAPMFANAGQAQAGTAAAGSVDATGGFRGQQSNAIDTLQAAAAGTAPSAAQEMLKQQTGANIASQLAMRASARGSNVGMAERAAADNVANLNANQATQSALVRANEQATARGQLGQAIEGARGQDINAQGINANLATDVSKFNTGTAADVSKTNAGLNTQTSLANSSQWNQSLQQQAEREQAARMANASAYNAAGAQQAGISAGEAGQTAALGTGVNTANAAAGNDMSKYLRSSFDQNQQFNAGQTNDYNKFVTGLTSQVGMSNTAAANSNNQFNAGQGNDMSKLLAQLNTQVGQNNLGAQVDFAKMDDQTKQAYLNYILGTQGQSVQVNNDINQTMLGANKAQAGALGGTLGFLGGLAGGAAL
jgi:hypothetical protein